MLTIDKYHKCLLKFLWHTTHQKPTFYSHNTSHPPLAGTASQELEYLVGAEFYCLYALADGNQRIRIREKTL